MAGAADISGGGDQQSTFPELHASLADQNTTELIRELFRNYEGSHDSTKLDSAIGLVEKLVAYDSRNQGALDHLLDIRNACEADTEDLAEDESMSDVESGNSSEPGELEWSVPPAQEESVRIVRNFLQQFDETGEADYLESAIRLAERLALLNTENEKPLNRLLKTRKTLNPILEPDTQMENTLSGTAVNNNTTKGSSNKNANPHSAPRSGLETAKLMEFCYDQYVETSETKYLEDVIQLAESLMVLTRATEVDQYYIKMLVDVVHSGANQDGSFERIGKAINWFEAAVAEIPPGETNRAFNLDHLGSMLSARHKRFGAFEDLEQAIKRTEEALAEIPPEHTDRAAMLNNLGNLMSDRYDDSGAVEDLEGAIKRCEEALAAVPPEDAYRATVLNSLSTLLSARYQRSGVIGDLEQAINRVEEALATPPDYSERGIMLSNLGSFLSVRYGVSGAIEDLEQAIERIEEALAATPPEQIYRGAMLNNLSSLLSSRYERSGAVKDLEKAIEGAEEALAAIPPEHTYRKTVLNNLGSLFSDKYIGSGAIEDLEQAIRLGGEALALTAPGDSTRATWLHNLSNHLRRRYRRLGALEDLEQATKRTAEALAETPPEHTYRAVMLDSLGNLLSDIYGRTGATEDLEQAIKCAEEAVAATPTGHIDRVWRLYSLSGHLSDRYKRFTAIEDLEQAIYWGEEALAATPPDHTGRPMMLDNLSNLMSVRYKRSGAVKYLEKAIKLVDEALALTPDKHPFRASWLNNLSNRLHDRYQKAGTIEDLERSIKYGEEAYAITPSEHTDQAVILGSLGYHLISKYIRTSSLQDFNYSLRILYSAWHCPTSPPRSRIKAARTVSILLSLKKMWQDSSSILADAVKLLPKISPRSTGRNDQEYQLSTDHMTQTTLHAVAHALQAGEDASYSLRLFELGRGLIMGLVIDCRSDLSELKKKHLEIFETFDSLRLEIDSPFASMKLDTAPGTCRPTYEQIRDRRQLVVNKLDETLASIRELPGFEGFQLPPHADYLMSMAKDGPIVLFNSTELRSDAIIATSSGIKSLRLRKELWKEAHEWMSEMCKLTTGARSTYTARNNRMREMLQWLWDVAVEPVCEALQLAPVPNDADLPRVWWIGAGALAMAPFHAAGNPRTKNNTMSRAISSYIPTIKALSYAREKKLELLGKRDSRILVVTMPTTPGKTWSDLPKAAEESNTIVNLSNGKADTKTLKYPSVAKVLEELPSHDAIHFACHGVSDPDSPSNSALLLQPEDNSNEPDRLTVEAISNTNIKRAQIAYLSACCTAQNTSEILADESIYIASGFQLAGFSHVLATQWVSKDDACPKVSGEFYRLLFDGQPCKTESGHRKVSASFHSAVKKLRDTYWKQPIMWASYIHTGA